MKKIILGLFLILGAVSFTMPNFINTTKLQKAGYNIVEDSETVLTIADTNVVDGDSILVASFNLKLSIAPFFGYRTSLTFGFFSNSYANFIAFFSC